MKLLYFLIMTLTASLAPAAPIQFESSARQTALLELYTSEGCSSCPPAEAWLSQLKDASGLWTNFVPVAFHVHYWDHLGWRDTLSDEQYSDRQQAYAKLWSAENIYTPEFVLNGKEWQNWRFKGTPSAPEATPGRLHVSSTDGRHWTATFSPQGKNHPDYEITAAVLVSDLDIDVKSGENAGRHLKHDFAALSFITRPFESQTNGLEAKFIIDDKSKTVSGRLALAVWVTRAGQLEPLQATGGWLSGTSVSPVRTK
jgi:hypothetical protein